MTRRARTNGWPGGRGYLPGIPARIFFNNSLVKYRPTIPAVVTATRKLGAEETLGKSVWKKATCGCPACNLRGGGFFYRGTASTSFTFFHCIVLLKHSKYNRPDVGRGKPIILTAYADGHRPQYRNPTTISKGLPTNLGKTRSEPSSTYVKSHLWLYPGQIIQKPQ